MRIQDLGFWGLGGPRALKECTDHEIMFGFLQDGVGFFPYLWLAGNGRMVVMVPSSIPY